jgi:hypothetical protein
MGTSHITAGGLLIALVATGCASLEHNRPACRWAAAGVGFVAGGLIGGFAINSLDLSGTKQTGAVVGGAIGGAALGAVLGAVIGNYACPEGAPPAPPEPVNAPPPETPPGAGP